MADKNYGLATVVGEVEEKDNSTQVPAQHTNDGQTPKGEQVALDRFINPLAIMNFGFTLQAGWQSPGLLLSVTLFNGGPAAMVWGTVLIMFGALGVACSLAEMASMDPHVGAQYRWSAGFARKSPNFWGLIQGWTTVFGWIVNVGPTLIVVAQAVQAIIGLNNSSYVPEAWHTTLLMCAFLVASIICNLFFRRVLATLETIGGLTHVWFFVIIIVVLTTMAERSTPKFVFTELISGLSGWNSPGLCWNLGLQPMILPLLNCDGVTHMIDETKEPRKRVPKTMILAVFLNSVMALTMTIVLLFCIGDIDETLATLPMPVISIYYQATKSKTAASVLMILHAFGVLISMFNCTASVIRLTWAFARDRGLPFHTFFNRVHPTLKIPIQSLGLVSVLLAILSLLNIASSTAFAAILSLPAVALSISYFIPITLLVIRKLKNEHPNYGPFQLGRWGLPINLWAMVFLVYCCINTAFPTMYPVTSVNMNYAGPITLGVLFLALVDYFTTGKRRFQPQTSNFNNIEMYDKKEETPLKK